MPANSCWSRELAPRHSCGSETDRASYARGHQRCPQTGQANLRTPDGGADCANASRSDQTNQATEAPPACPASPDDETIARTTISPSWRATRDRPTASPDCGPVGPAHRPRDLPYENPRCRSSHVPDQRVCGPSARQHTRPRALLGMCWPARARPIQQRRIVPICSKSVGGPKGNRTPGLFQCHLAARCPQLIVGSDT
jgi:hypothetical protein